jgi:hypothetical protein
MANFSQIEDRDVFGDEVVNGVSAAAAHPRIMPSTAIGQHYLRDRAMYTGLVLENPKKFGELCPFL